MTETSFFDSFIETGSKIAEGVGNYLNKNEWASDALAGAAAGAGQYLLQEDQQKHERDLLREKQRFEVDVNTIKPAVGGSIASDFGGALTGGLLAPKKVTP